MNRRSCTVRSWRRRIRLCGRFPYRPTIGGACGMYRPSIRPVSAIERAIVCMRMQGLADLRQPISRGFLHTATSGGAPGFFYARCARLHFECFARERKQPPPPLQGAEHVGAAHSGIDPRRCRAICIVHACSAGVSDDLPQSSLLCNLSCPAQAKRAVAQRVDPRFREGLVYYGRGPPFLPGA